MGGSGNLNSYNEDYTYPSSQFGTAKSTEINLSVSGGYFIIDKLAGGLRPTFFFIKGESSGGGKWNQYRLAIGPYVRYYLLKDDNQFNLLTDVS